MKDYYLVLGVGADATPQEIRSAYRRQAKKLHPDYSGPDCGPFRDLQEAYECLSDPNRRQAHDRALLDDRRRSPSRPSYTEPLWSSGAPVEPVEPRRRSGHVRERWEDLFFRSPLDDLFDDLWDDLDLDGMQQQTMHVEVVMSREQAARGGRLAVQVPMQTVCPLCQGSGRAMFYRCPECDGRGSRPGQYPLTVKLPPGIQDGTVGHVTVEQLALRLVLHFRVSRR